MAEINGGNMRLIDEAKVINEIERFKGYLDDDMIMRIKIAINKLPTIDAEPVRHGKWIWEECVYKCSYCSHKAYGNILECMDGTYKYCPNCGARMEIEENERKRANDINTTI